ncbi:sensory box histidine kinase [Cystobacter fuscus DSM 2262]|uniref:histidine kinase n=1 Tax=Cystobacter fuscus (strain ATCC 25194 / DSM 2262 / NBRC 100088 / M29) TaxID=1242864 RepID=S9PA41_CYSF2|nr:PAS domain-containing protein [Cystobacter fuscus]EPX61275.1 sensory box histidine kinase [Cystobacter fuscus DSM 2262]
MESDEHELEHQAVERMFPGGGQMGARMRATDWASTPLGPVLAWPRELRACVGMVLANHFPMNLLWGPELVQLYNDAYLPLMGDKHPAYLGRPCREAWPEVWPQLEPRLRQVLDSGVSTTRAKLLLFLHRHGFTEECYFTDSYAPVWGQGEQVAGVLVTVVEDTQMLLAERRLLALRDLATETTGVGTSREACERIADVLRFHSADVPFALLYLCEGHERRARLALAVGLEAGGAASPKEIILDASVPSPWPLAAARSEALLRVDLRARAERLPGGPWPESPREALVLSLGMGESSSPFGFLVLGTSPRARLDGPYQDFLRMLAGQVSVLLSSVRARERAEKEQREAHQRIADILETMGDVFLAVDKDWRLTRVNSMLERMAGKPRGELVGHVLWELWPNLRLPTRDYWAEYHRCMHERVPVRFLDHQENLDVWLEARAHPTPDGGMAVFLRDVGDQKRTEVELDRIFTLSRELLCVSGLDGYLKRVNPAWERTLGWSEAELLSTPLERLVHPEDLAAHAANVERLRQGEEVTQSDLRMRHRDGTWRWLSWSITPESRLGLLFSVARDVTEAKRLAADEKGRADFEQQLIGIVSHDLRNPLSAIALGAQALLRRETLDAHATRTAVRILSAAERGTRMVRDLLDFTQARLGGGLPIRPEPMDLHLLTRQVLDEMQMSFPERDFQLLQQGDARGEWDGDRMVQLLTNLLTNAAKYSPAGTPILVSMRGEPLGVELEVHNGGDPIAPEVLNRLFQPMQRGGDSGATVSRSVGLGLYIVKHIVDVHGGHIDVSSTEADGTAFHVRLPRRPPSFSERG